MIAGSDIVPLEQDSCVVHSLGYTAGASARLTLQNRSLLQVDHGLEVNHVLQIYHELHRTLALSRGRLVHIRHHRLAVSFQSVYPH